MRRNSAHPGQKSGFPRSGRSVRRVRRKWPAVYRAGYPQATWALQGTDDECNSGTATLRCVGFASFAAIAKPTQRPFARVRVNESLCHPATVKSTGSGEIENLA